MQSCLKWYGGKAKIAKKLIDLMPAHTRFLDGFCGSMAVTLAKPYEGISEYANDLNGDLQNFWKVVIDPRTFSEFRVRVMMSPLSEPAFEESTELLKSDDPVVRALAFFIRCRQSHMGLGASYCTPTTRTRRGMNEQVSAWLSAVERLPEIASRLLRVEIWNRPAVEAIQRLDDPTLFAYLDPPYVHETRSGTDKYGIYELSTEDHTDLLDCISKMRGKFLLSGYRCKLYDDFAANYNWDRVDILVPNSASNAKEKEIKCECVWLNYSI